MNNYRYTTFTDFLVKKLPGKVQKISIHAGFTCPNRDGSIGYGGCTYCNNQTFSPDYCHTGESITLQLEKGIRFFSRKYPSMKYLAYFQAYTNTYAELRQLIRMYEEALNVEGIIGLVIGTRPDCMPDDLLQYLSELSKKTFILIEYGIESTDNKTLKQINRGHTWEQSEEIIRKTANYNLLQGLHLILGLPGENKKNQLTHARIISTLPIQTIKLHQLQLIRKTKMGEDFLKNPDKYHLYPVDEYIDLAIDFIELIPSAIAIERFTSQSPEELLIAPKWGLKNYEFTHRLLRRMEERNTWQGRLTEPF